MIDDVDNDEKNKTLKHLKEENLFHHHVHVEMCPLIIIKINDDAHFTILINSWFAIKTTKSEPNAIPIQLRKINN
ncbi:hypothetical protein DERP_000401 [Dermatophagoides pteronyssinus]|uniref:Uncharacterized protein n=1 Tax=Dermatophagoides pteronyssinus TaxID=6956 RepID=A0ABQ8J056_DERPT|nr:hypothetical protein DERP_000401 [Dermatophagoides pteronyssinus]